MVGTSDVILTGVCDWIKCLWLDVARCVCENVERISVAKLVFSKMNLRSFVEPKEFLWEFLVNADDGYGCGHGGR